MARYAIINGSDVINVVEYDTTPANPPPGYLPPVKAVKSDVASPGWTYLNNTFIAPETENTPPIIVPVPMWAFRTILQANNLFDQVQTIVSSSTDPALKNVWEYGNFATRNSIAINTIAYTLGLTEQQVDQMFIDANNLSV